jgi:hypothetical protein
MTEITPEHALLAVEAAGLDPTRPLTEQLDGVRSDDGAQGDEGVEGDDVAQQLAALGERIEALAEATRQAGQPADPQARERAFAESYLSALNASRTRWLGDEQDG